MQNGPVRQPIYRGPLPPHRGEVRNLALAASSAGFFLGITTDAEPCIAHASHEGDRLAWGAPWIPPVPVTAHRPTWAAYEGSCDNLVITVDRRDPLRIGVNLLEYQGGSFGLLVGRWGGAFEYVPYAFDSDLPFGEPLVLHGDDVLTFEGREQLRHYRPGGFFTELGFDAQRGFEVHHAEIDAAAETLVLGAGRELLVLERRGAGDFALARRWPTSEVISALTVTRDGRPIVASHCDGQWKLFTYDRDGRESIELAIPFGTLDDGASQPPYWYGFPRIVWTDGLRAVFETQPGFVVVDLLLGDQVRLDAPYPADARGGRQYYERAFVLHNDHAVVATRDGVALYSLA